MSKPKARKHRLVVEKAIAFGRSPEWMEQHLGATPAEIADAVQWVEEINAQDEDGQPAVKCGTVKGYNRHVHRGEPVDKLCRAARSRATRQRKARKRARERAAAAPSPVADLSRPIDSYYRPADQDVIDGIVSALNGAA